MPPKMNYIHMHEFKDLPTFSKPWFDSHSILLPFTSGHIRGIPIARKHYTDS